MASGTAQALPTYPGGFTALPNWVWTSALSPSAKAVLAALLHDDWRKTLPKYRPPGTAALAAWVAGTRPTVIAAIRELERFPDPGTPVISVDRRFGAAHVYHVNHAVLDAGPVKNLAREPEKKSARSARKPVKILSTVKTAVRPPRKDWIRAKPKSITMGSSSESVSTAGHEAGCGPQPADPTSSLGNEDQVNRAKSLTGSTDEAYVDDIMRWMGTADQRAAARTLIDRRGPLLTHELLSQSDDPGAKALQEFMTIVYADTERDRQRQAEAAEPVF